MINNVNGSIIRIDEDSIHCELNTKPKTRFVNLPKIFFKDIKVRVGLPINLKVKDIGIPIISERELKKQKCEFFDDINF